MTPYTADVGVAYCILQKSHAVTEDFCHGHWVTGSLAAWSRGHWQFSGVVTRSQTVFERSQIVTPVAGLSMARIGVTTPCTMSVTSPSQGNLDGSVLS